MKNKYVKSLAVGMAAQAISIVAMWCLTEIEILGIAFLSLFALGFGSAITALALERKEIPAKQRKPPKIYTYTSAGRCLEGAYQEVKIG